MAVCPAIGWRAALGGRSSWPRSSAAATWGTAAAASPCRPPRCASSASTGTRARSWRADSPTGRTRRPRRRPPRRRPRTAPPPGPAARGRSRSERCPAARSPPRRRCPPARASPSQTNAVKLGTRNQVLPPLTRCRSLRCDRLGDEANAAFRSDMRNRSQPTLW